MNLVILSGGLTKDPEMRYTPDGKAVTSFSMGTDAGKGKSDYHNCECWERLAEVVGEHCKKGSKVIVQGSLKTDSWEKDGVKRYKTFIRVFSLEFAGPKPQEGGSSSQSS